jgi:hypothetical protein
MRYDSDQSMVSGALTALCSVAGPARRDWGAGPAPGNRASGPRHCRAGEVNQGAEAWAPRTHRRTGSLAAAWTRDMAALVDLRSGRQGVIRSAPTLTPASLFRSGSIGHAAERAVDRRLNASSRTRGPGGKPGNG